MHAASSSSIQPRNALGWPWILGPAMAMGKMPAVSSTRNNEIPSTPRCQRIPNSGIHV